MGEPTCAGNFYPIATALPGELLSRCELTAPHLYAGIRDSTCGAPKGVDRRMDEARVVLVKVGATELWRLRPLSNSAPEGSHSSKGP